MAAKKVRIALVGAGHVAQVAHIPAYKRNPNAELVAVVDEDPVKARRIKEQFGFGEWYEDIADMLKSADVDAVDICTPNFLHAPMAIAALRTGRHVLCEKPLARTLAEAEQMVEASEKHGRILMVAYNNRYRDDVTVLAKLIRGKELGDVHIVKAGWLRRAGEWEDRSWLLEKHKAGGGALLDLGAPLMDLAIYLSNVKKPTAVMCGTFGKKGKGGVEESACAMVRFAGGACLMLEVNWNLREPRDVIYLHVYGSRGAAILNPLQIHKSVQGVLVNVTPAIEKKNFFQQGYQYEIDHFVECVQDGKQPATSGKDALQVLRILDAMYASAASGRETTLSQ